MNVEVRDTSYQHSARGGNDPQAPTLGRLSLRGAKAKPAPRPHHTAGAGRSLFRKGNPEHASVGNTVFATRASAGVVADGIAPTS